MRILIIEQHATTGRTMAKGEDECNICSQDLRSINGWLLCPACDCDILGVPLKAEHRQPTEKQHDELKEENKKLREENNKLRQ